MDEYVEHEEGYVLWSPEVRKYLALWNHPHLYTSSLDSAQRFSKEEAFFENDYSNEIVIACNDIIVLG